MKGLIFATAALSIAAVAPASAQMMGQPGMAMGAQSCVMNGQFVPCPPGGGMRPGPGPMNPLAAPGMVAGAAVGAATGVVAGTAAGVGAGMAAGAGMVEEPRMRRRMTARERREQRRMMRQQQSM